MTGATGQRVGVDLGGTKTRMVLVGPDGQMIAGASRATAHYGVGSAALDGLTADLEALIGDRDVDFVGVGASGPVRPDGVIENPATLPGFSGLDLPGHLRSRLGIACHVDNDALTAALGEWTYGAGRGARRLLLITLGTGIGVAVVDDGVPYTGTDGINPESGHSQVAGEGNPCYCGLGNCWEQTASRAALQQLALAAVPADVAAAGPQAAVAHLARSPEPGGVFAEYSRRVALGLASLLTVHRPDVVVLGGSGAEQFELIEPGLLAGLADRPAYYAPFRLRPAALGDLSGALGAACLADVGGPDEVPVSSG